MSQPTQLTAIQQNARALRGNGDLAGARLMLEQGLEAAKASLGEDHPEVLSTAHLLAGLHREAGEPAAARRVLEEAVAAGQRRYGDGEPLMLALSYTLGTVADELGNRHEARRNLSRVATAGPAVLGEDHAWVRAARGYLGEDAVAGSSAPAQSPVSASPTAHGPPAAPPATPSPPRHNPPPPSPPPPSPPPAYQSPQVGQYPSFGPGTGITATAPPGHVPTPAPPARRGRGSTVAAAIAAAAAVLAATVAAVVVLTDDRAPDPTPPQGQGTSSRPSAAARSVPPERVRLNDDGSVVTLTWRDPSDGTAPFIVAGARAGDQQRAMGQVPAGGTRYRLNGLNPNLDYCFVVIAVYSADQLVPSERVCTRRPVQPSATGADG